MSDFFGWKNGRFEATSDLNVEGVCVCGNYFPVDDDYPSDEYVETRNSLSSASQYKELTASEFNTIFAMNTWSQTITSGTTTEWMRISFQKKDTETRFYNFKEFWLIFVVPNENEINLEIRNPEFRIGKGDEVIEKYHRQLTASNLNWSIKTTTIDNEFLLCVKLTTKSEEPIELQNNESVLFRFTAYCESPFEIHDCFTLLQDQDFAQDVSDEIGWNGEKLQFIDV